jgi:2-iminobutanoate/2-iminopropanoate deaminase
MIRIVETEHAPKAIGPYSQAVAAGPFLFVSGQLPVNPGSGKITAANIKGQTKQVLDNIEGILKAQGLSFAHVVKVEVFLKDLKDFQEMNAIYAERFDTPVKPARQTVQVSKLPLDALLEVSCIAYKG